MKFTSCGWATVITLFAVFSQGTENPRPLEISNVVTTDVLAPALVLPATRPMCGKETLSDRPLKQKSLSETQRGLTKGVYFTVIADELLGAPLSVVVCEPFQPGCTLVPLATWFLT